MVIWDTNILALYFSNRLSPDDHLRVKGMVSELARKREPIGVPAQVWAEFLEAATADDAAQSIALFKTNAFKLLTYDMRAAIETAEVARRGHAARKGSQNKDRGRQAVKVDWQIIAVAIVNNARLILTNDQPMLSECRRHKVQCMAISDLPIPDDLRQHPITFD
ncbi:type II toxin-antitoxin system VapC family toxin [Pseudomonas farris]